VKTRDGKSVTRRIERNLTASAGFRSRPTDKASTRGIHQGQRSCKDRTERPDTWLQATTVHHAKKGHAHFSGFQFHRRQRTP